MKNNTKTTIEDKNEFYKSFRVFFLHTLNALSGFSESMSEDEKTNIIMNELENSISMLTPPDYDNFITLKEIELEATPFIKVDPITNTMYIFNSDIGTLFTNVRSYILYKISSNLEKIGFCKLCWDEKENDFKYVWKDENEPKN